MKYKFVTDEVEPEVTKVNVSVEQEKGGVTIKVGEYYLCTLKHTGVLLLHAHCRADGVLTDDEGQVVIEREDG
jgi:hypothetical protein